MPETSAPETPQEETPTQRFTRLLVDTPMYARLAWESNEALQLANWLRLSGVRVDAYCPQCRADSTFIGNPQSPSAGVLMNLNRSLAFQTAAGLRRFELTCARVTAHVAVFCLQATIHSPTFDDIRPVECIELEKIGQFPALADLEAGRLRGYQGLVDEQDLAELRRAAGLAAHGIGIGSFVYLRRVFERLKERAHTEAAKGQGWDENAYRRGDTAEQIGILSAFLPKFVVDNRRVYSILSIGLHELSEEQCRDAYDVVETAILLMLDEVRNAREREKRIAAATRSVAALESRLARKEP